MGTDVSKTIPCKEMAATVCNRTVEIITRGKQVVESKEPEKYLTPKWGLKSSHHPSGDLM